MDDVLKRILSLLKENNKTQKDLTKYLGINDSAVTEWKKGKTKSYNHYLYQISEFFSVTIDYLRLGQKITAPNSGGGADRTVSVKLSESEWNDLLDGLSDESLVQLRDYTRYLVWKQDQELSD